MLAPESRLVGDEVEDGGQVCVGGAEQAEEEGEEGDVAVVAGERVGAVFDGGVAVGLSVCRPVQAVDVVLDALAVGCEATRVGRFAHVLGDGVQGAGHGADPAESVQVELAGVGRLRARVVVETTCKYVLRGSAFPAVGLVRGEVGPGVGRQVGGLSLAEPVVVAFK